MAEKSAGRRLAKLRKRSGLSIKKASELMGVNKRTLCRYEAGCTEPRIGLVPKMCEVYGCTMEEVIEADEIDEPPVE